MRALVTGSRGQDGSFLCELLEEHGYDVVGVDRDGVELTDARAVETLLREAAPRELYNLASPSFVPASWDDPAATMRAGVAVGVLLDAIVRVDPAIRFLQASSAEVFGRPDEVPQTESTPYRPRSPYGASKAAADYLVGAYRDRHGLHASSAILFNHESPRHADVFLPVKVARAAARREPVALGDLDARRDWGYAPDYVRAMWLMLQQDGPDDFVIATGEAHTVRELAELAYAHVGLDWRDYVSVDAALVRGDTKVLVGDASKAGEVLGWAPSVSFAELVALLVDAESA
jgi:GDPmannose 4,6-dehydratase